MNKTPGEIIMQNKRNPSFVPRWFSIWFYISCLLLFIGGALNLIFGGAGGGFDPFGASIMVFLSYLIVVFVWRIRSSAQIFASIIPLPAVLVSVVIGWSFAMIDEIINYPFNPLFPDISFFGDLLITTPMYLGAHLMWFYVLKKYRFSAFQALFTGGFSLGLTELFLGGGGVLAFIGFLILPFVVMIHGIHMVMPKVFLSSYFEKQTQIDSKWKYVMGIVLPLIGLSVGIGVFYVIAQMFGISIN